MKMKRKLLRSAGRAAVGISFLWCGVVHGEGFTGQYLATGNFSTQDSLMPSMNNRLTMNATPSWTTGNFDFRLEQYVENSFHGTNDSMVRERKFEGQVNYNYPLTPQLSATVGALRHENHTFRDNYFWGVAGLVWSGDIAPDTGLTAGVLAEKRNKGGRLFYDLSAAVEHKFKEKYGAFASAHVYENLGEFDPTPTHKREYEIGLNYYPNKRYTAGVSYFYHQQIGDPTDRFSFVKLKLGVNF